MLYNYPFVAQQQGLLNLPFHNHQETCGDFFEKVKLVIFESGVPMGKILYLQNKLLKTRSLNERDKVIRAINENILPAYILLRKQGYNHSELVA